ncbi:MAG: hypothetical protein JWM20_180 [Patescibacteria group bacterium]|nr:hypothetical protein [Patescibacteria group bacterium]
MKQKKILAAIEMFWSSWNPVVTEETTKPLYRLLGGNKRPVFATMITFLYTGIFLHAFGAGIIWLYVFAFISKDFHFMKGFFFGSCIVVIAYFVIGMLVAFSKYRKKRST